MMTKSDEDIYRYVIDFARDHYENFPVISFLIPKRLQMDVAALYWFARTADDIADEGSLSSEERLEELDKFEHGFNCLLQKIFKTPFEEALFHTITRRNLNAGYFYNLLKAFRQDIVKKRYFSYMELTDYCSNSANPVGRLMLQLFNIRNDAADHYSDKICTALQITNFLQDLAIDYKKGRIYLPQEELSYFGVEESSFEDKKFNDNFRELIKFYVERTYKMFEQGKNLFPYLEGKLKLEIKWTVASGEEVLNKIRKIDYNVLQNRPSLNKIDFITLFARSLI